MTHTVVGLFNNRSEAQAAMQELMRDGFIKDHIDVSNRSVSETAATGSTGASSNEGVGDSISNFFGSLFGDDPATAQNYTNAAYDADAILTVQVDSDERARLAADILDRHGAIDVDEHGSGSTGQNFTGNTTQAGNTTQTAHTTGASRTEGEMAIPVIEEELHVGKRQVESGGARIRSRVIERPVEETVRLREEHVVVNRRPVNRAVTDSDLANFREGDIELTERAERAVVGKEAHVVEEVVVGKEVTEREETIRDTVRRTDVDVQEIDTNVTTSEDVNTRRANS